MPLKTSFFNPTLFRKNLSRSWPLWGGITILGALIPLYLMLTAINTPRVQLDLTDFTQLLYSAVVYFLPVFTFCYSVLVAMLVWGYLHHPRSVGFMHSLSISRTGLFFTNALSGLAMLLIPYVVVGGLLVVLFACYGAVDIGAVFVTIAAVLLENLLFFGMATLCAAITGSVIVTAAYYLILNFIVPAMDLLLTYLAEDFIFGLSLSVSDLSLRFAPLAGLYENVELRHHYTDDHLLDRVYIDGFGIIALYGLVGAGLLALAWYLMKIRRSESAGDVVAFPWLRPVFRFGVAFVSSLTLGRVLYELFWTSIYSYERIVPMGICMAISGVAGYYAASMLLEKTRRVFTRGSLKSVGIICGASALLCLVIGLDLFGIEKYVPEEDSIASVELTGILDITCNADELPELLGEIRTLHSAVVADKDYIRGEESYYGDQYWRSLNFTYRLKNGSEVTRYYYLPISTQRMEDPSAYDGMLRALVKHPDVLIASVTIPENSRLMNAWVEGYSDATGQWEGIEINSADLEIIYAALLRDAAEGNFVVDSYKFNRWNETTEISVFTKDAALYFEYRLDGNEEYGFQYGTIYVQLQPGMRHTLNALTSCGVITDSMIRNWQADEK